MDVTIEEGRRQPGCEVRILCQRVDARIEGLAARIRLLDRRVSAYSDGRLALVPAGRILYAESVEGRTFLYTAQDALECRLRLSELEERLRECGFIRIARQAIVNFSQVEQVRPLINARLLLELANGERLIASRHYASQIRSLLEEAASSGPLAIGAEQGRK